MLRSILIGLVAGQRAMTPLALVTQAARKGDLPADPPGGALLANPIIGASAHLLAAAEMAGDKMKTAPDRTVALGLIARSLTSGFAGAALAPKGERKGAALLAVATALASSHVGLALRLRAMQSFGQTPTGLVEDGLVLAAGRAIIAR
ncbi:DUF4126 domain-containing protein [Sphingomonas crocodyli]|uniref:DUF4126 domain-containing protein n=2 Tax=Sphingomonas crocodyli TaxID=1979270 RepID=A0A437MBM6_9SPHN|nr:DUF4126 domain-containing protein [Sphingomonas crocodyli]